MQFIQVLALLTVSLFHSNAPASVGALNSHLTDFASHTYLNGNLQLSSTQQKELQCYLKVVWHEARGESKRGKILVANVVRNRTQFGKPFANTVCAVVYQRNQFAWTRDKKKKNSNFKQIAKVNWKHESRQVLDTVKVALDFTLFNHPDVTKATHFCTATEKCNFQNVDYLGRVGGHKFYKYRGNP